MPPRPALSPLALRWHVFAMCLIALMRGLERMRRAGEQETPRRAEELEVMARAAYTLLLRDIAALSPSEAGAGAAHSRAHLCLLASSLLTMAYIAMNVRRQWAEARQTQQKPGRAFTRWQAAQAPARMGGRVLPAPLAIDSS